MDIKYINPFVSATIAVFSQMLDCKLTRGELRLGESLRPQYEVVGVIGLSGRMSGTVAVCLDKDLAVNATRAMLGDDSIEFGQDVVDAVGELTNIIAGNAKSQLEQFQMSLSLPTVLVGGENSVNFGHEVHPICIPFESEWGSLTITVGLRVEEARDD